MSDTTKNNLLETRGNEYENEFDDFLDEIGAFKKYQILHYFLICQIGVMSAFSTMSYVFVAGVPQYHCNPPTYLLNTSISNNFSMLYPLEDKNGEERYSQCLMYDWSDVVLDGKSFIDANEVNVSGLPVMKCSSWIYDRSEYSETLVSKWNLVCGREFIAATIAAGNAAGNLFGAAISGYASDRFGRRRVLVVTMFSKGLFGVAVAFAPHPWVFIAGMFFVSVCSIATFQTGFVLVMEMVGQSWRLFAGMSLNWFWAIGYLIVAAVAYFVRDWFTLQIVMHSPMMILGLLYAWLLPESPRWLLQKGRKKEAHKLLYKMAKINGVNMDGKVERVRVADRQDKRSAVSISTLTKSDYMVVFTITSCFIWFTTSLIYYGTSYNTSNLGGNHFVNFALSAAIEIPAYGLSLILLQYIGRRISVIGCLWLAGICLCLTAAVPTELNAFLVTLAMIGKFSVTAVFGMIYVYASEMYPTTKRSVGLGVSSTFARIGSVCAPYIAMLGNVASKEVPLVIFGITSLIAGLSTFLLPETKNLPLPDTIDDLKKFEDTLLCARSGRKKASDEENDEKINTLLADVDSKEAAA